MQINKMKRNEQNEENDERRNLRENLCIVYFVSRNNNNSMEEEKINNRKSGEKKCFIVQAKFEDEQLSLVFLFCLLAFGYIYTKELKK